MSNAEKPGRDTNPPKPCPAIWESIGGGSHACCARPDGHPGVHETARGTAFPPERTRICKPAECTPSAYRPMPSDVRASLIAFARATWRNDGAEGETVHRLCDELEHALRMGQVSPPTTPEAEDAMLADVIELWARDTANAIHEGITKETLAHIIAKAYLDGRRERRTEQGKDQP